MVIDEQLIQDLSNYILLKTGKRYFSRIKTVGKNIMVSCPYHKEGQERKPSCGIKKVSDEKSNAGTVNCFTCHITTNLADMVKYVLGDKYNEDEVEARFGLKLALVRETAIQEIKSPAVSFKIPIKQNNITYDDLSQYRTYHRYLENRKISKNTAEVYDIGYDNINDHITFPIKDIYNNCLGIGRRAIKEKQYIYPLEFVKPLYGIYELPLFINHLWVVEGPFNLWSLYEYHKSGVALLGTGTQYQYKQLLTVKCNDYVLALDGDNAGHLGTKKLGSFLFNNRKKVYVACVPNNHDINDMSYEQFKQMEVIPYENWVQLYKNN